MFNLLPDSLKEKIRSEYYLRLIIVVSIFIIGIQISFLALLFPSWLISLDKEKEIALQAEASGKSSLDSQISSVNTAINLINAKLTTINTTLTYPEAIPLIDSILSQKPRNVRISEMTYTWMSTSTSRIIVAGVSATRESLVLFGKNLEKSKIFSNVDLPISNFAKDKDIDFSMSMTIKQ